jgi:hypothetical protein
MDEDKVVQRSQCGDQTSHKLFFSSNLLIWRFAKKKYGPTQFGLALRVQLGGYYVNPREVVFTPMAASTN